MPAANCLKPRARLVLLLFISISQSQACLTYCNPPGADCQASLSFDVKPTYRTPAPACRQLVAGASLSRLQLVAASTHRRDSTAPGRWATGWFPTGSSHDALHTHPAPPDRGLRKPSD